MTVTATFSPLLYGKRPALVSMIWDMKTATEVVETSVAVWIIGVLSMSIPRTFYIIFGKVDIIG